MIAKLTWCSAIGCESKGNLVIQECATPPKSSLHVMSFIRGFRTASETIVWVRTGLGKCHLTLSGLPLELCSHLLIVVFLALYRD